VKYSPLNFTTFKFAAMLIVYPRPWAKFACLDRPSKSHSNEQLNIKQVNFIGASINTLDKGQQRDGNFTKRC